MIDLFKSDFAPIENSINFNRQPEEKKIRNVESFANADFERQYNDSKILKVVEKDPYSDIRIRSNEESKVVNDLNPEQKHYEDNNKENEEELIDDNSNAEYTIDDFGKDVVCNCGVNVIKANNIINEVSKKEVNLDIIASKLDEKKIECVLKKINKYKLKQFPKEAIKVVKKNEENIEEPVRSNEVKVTNKVKLRKEIKRKQNVKLEEEEEEEEDDSDNIFKDIFSNEIILLIVIIILAFTYLK